LLLCQHIFKLFMSCLVQNRVYQKQATNLFHCYLIKEKTIVIE
jgi:hypothetical protein